MFGVAQRRVLAAGIGGAHQRAGLDGAAVAVAVPHRDPLPMIRAGGYRSQGVAMHLGRFK
ncbi:MAG: hypothetical protein JWN68_3072 [Nocardioides sp.]|nr:hypothetical protein [Nocardioides sp.]